jgi:hypothetical protein
MWYLGDNTIVENRLVTTRVQNILKKTKVLIDVMLHGYSFIPCMARDQSLSLAYPL